jgi:hypothetical protein
MALVCEEVHGIAREVRHHRGRCGCRAAAREWVFAGLAHGSATPKLHERLHTRRTFDDEQVRLNEKAPISGAFAEPSSGLEPETPSLPRNHQEPLCGTPYPQIEPDRWGRSYRFS